MARFEGFVDLSAPPTFAGMLAGNRSKATIASVPLVVILPAFGPIQPHFTEVLYPSEFVGNWQQAHSSGPRALPWANVKRSYGEQLVTFATYRLAVVSQNETTESEAQDVANAASDWAERIVLWTEVLSATDLCSRMSPSENSVEILFKDVKCNRPIYSQNPQRIYGTIKRADISDAACWEKVLRQASTAAEVPAAHRFLREARKQLTQGRFRDAVLAAATATEISLAQLLETELVASVSRAEIAKIVRDNAQMMGKLIGICKKLYPGLPEHLKETVAGPRNQAIHAGSEPSEQQVRECLRDARTVVGLAFPLSAL
jgi:HEPN domain-containing protein